MVQKIGKNKTILKAGKIGAKYDILIWSIWRITFPRRSGDSLPKKYPQDWNVQHNEDSDLGTPDWKNIEERGRSG